MSIVKKLLSQTLLYGISTVLGRLIGFVITPILTGVFGTSDYGTISVFFAYIALVSVSLTHGMETTFFYFLNQKYSKNTILSNALTSVAIVSIVFVFLVMIFKSSIQQISTETMQHSEVIWWFVVILVLDAFSSILFAKLRAEERALEYSIVKIINILLNITLLCFLLFGLETLVKLSWCPSFLESIYHSGYGTTLVFLSNLVVSVLTFCILLFRLGIFIPKPNFSLLIKMWKYTWPIMIALLGWQINENLDRLLLEYLLPHNEARSEIGIYSAVYKICILIKLVSMAFILGIEPFYFSEAKKENSKTTYATILNYYSAALCLCLILILANIDWIKPMILGQESYYEGISILPFLLFGQVFLGIYMNLSIWYKLTKNTIYGAYITFIGVGTTLVLNWILIPFFGYWGATITTFCVYLSMMLISYFWGKKLYYIPYHYRKIAFYILLSIVFVVLFYYMSNNNFVFGNLSAILFAYIVYWLNKEEMNTLINKKNI